MIFNEHTDLIGQHAFLGASKYHWLGYSDEKIIDTYRNSLALKRGTVLHDFASRCIKLSQKLPYSKKSLNSFVNDAIGFRMQSKQVLFYSKNCFGTADAISFDGKTLRIHDLKTGLTQSHMEQLQIYAALFCLEYKKAPSDINIELRIYQSNDILILLPQSDDIEDIMNKIVRFDALLEKTKNEVGDHGE